MQNGIGGVGCAVGAGGGGGESSQQFVVYPTMSGIPMVVAAPPDLTKVGIVFYFIFLISSPSPPIQQKEAKVTKAAHEPEPAVHTWVTQLARPLMVGTLRETRKKTSIATSPAPTRRLRRLTSCARARTGPSRSINWFKMENLPMEQLFTCFE